MRTCSLPSRYAASLVDPSILFLTYEELIRDPSVGITKVANHIGVGNDPATVALAAANSAMANMKATSGVYAGNVRAGGIGNWRKQMPEHSVLNSVFDGEYLKQMRGTGLKLDFGDGLVL